MVAHVQRTSPTICSQSKKNGYLVCIYDSVWWIVRIM